MSSRYDVVVAGQACLDLTPKFKDKNRRIEDIFKPGGGMRLNGIEFSGGGAVCNTGLALHKLGITTLLWGQIGDDAFGSQLRLLLENKGAVVKLVKKDYETTSYTLVIVQPGQDRIFLHDPGVDDSWKAADMDYQLLKKTKVFHFGYPTAMASMYSDGAVELTELFKNAKQTGVLTSLDMSRPHHGAETQDWVAILERTLRYVDIFCPSVEEAIALLEPELNKALIKESNELSVPLHELIDRAKVMEMGQRFVKMGAKVSFIKCSINGMYFCSGSDGLGEDYIGWENKSIWQDALVAGDVISTSGAGDTAIAGLLSGVVNKLSPIFALKCAAMAGAIAVTSLDSQQNLPSDYKQLLELALKSKSILQK